MVHSVGMPNPEFNSTPNRFQGDTDFSHNSWSYKGSDHFALEVLMQFICIELRPCMYRTVKQLIFTFY